MERFLLRLLMFFDGAEGAGSEVPVGWLNAALSTGAAAWYLRWQDKKGFSKVDSPQWRSANDKCNEYNQSPKQAASL